MPEARPFTDHPLPDIKGSGPLLIVGGARHVLDDIEAYWGKEGWQHPKHAVMAVNHIGMFLPDLTHWFTPHPQAMDAWEAARKAFPGFGNMDYRKHCKVPPREGFHCWPVSGHWGQYGGMCAVIIAKTMGYSPIVMAGMPADHSGWFYPVRRSVHSNESYGGGFDGAWKRIKAEFGDGVTSLSGRTKEIFG